LLFDLIPKIYKRTDNNLVIEKRSGRNEERKETHFRTLVQIDLKNIIDLRSGRNRIEDFFFSIIDR
jgi:hypothetical protein